MTPDAVTPDAVTPGTVAPGSTVAVAFSTQRATPRTLPDQLTYIDTLLGELTTKVERDQPVPVQLLREIAESIAAVAYHIESRPNEVTSAQVVAYIHAAADGRVLLAAAVAAARGRDGAERGAQRGAGRRRHRELVPQVPLGLSVIRSSSAFVGRR